MSDPTTRIRMLAHARGWEAWIVPRGRGHVIEERSGWVNMVPFPSLDMAAYALRHKLRASHRDQRQPVVRFGADQDPEARKPEDGATWRPPLSPPVRVY